MMGSIATVVGRNLDTGVARESIRQWTSFRDSIWDSCSAAHNRRSAIMLVVVIALGFASSGPAQAS